MGKFYKLSIVLLTVFFLRMLASCCENHKYYDYATLGILTLKTTLTSQDSLVFILEPPVINYLADLSTGFGFNQAYGYQCEGGWGGMKFPIEQIDIICNNDFDAAHPAGTSLTDLFLRYSFSREITSSGGLVPAPVTEPLSAEYLELWLPTGPAQTGTYRFFITVIKSNQDTIIVPTPAVTWQ